MGSRSSVCGLAGVAQKLVVAAIRLHLVSRDTCFVWFYGQGSHSLVSVGDGQGSHGLVSVGDGQGSHFR
jgi:hypothetical protein